MESLREFSPNLIYVIISLTIILSIYLYCTYKLSYWKRRGVHQLNDTSKIFGDFRNGILFRTAPGYHMGNIYRAAPKNVPYIGFYIFHKPCLLLKDPEIIKEVLIRSFDKFSDRHFAGAQQKDSTGMINLFGLRNPAWRYLRKRITPTLALSKLKQMLPFMMESGKPMMEHIEENIVDDKRKVFDVQHLNFKYASDFIANIALGIKTDSFKNPDSEYTRYLMDFFYSFKRMVALVTVFFIPELVKIVGSRMLFDSSFIHKFFWRAVQTREESGLKRGDYIDSIIQLKNGEQDSLYKFEGDQLLYQLGIFFAGFESSSTATAFTLSELAKNPEHQSLAREDIRNAIDKYGWTVDAFNKMKYLDQCIAEGVRLHPPVSTIDRLALEDYQIPNSDLVIEKGTAVYISLYGLHGDSEFFDEPEKFDPDRFSDDRTVSDAYLPFGAGPRKCIGLKLGVLYVKVVLSMILTEYKVSQEPAEVNKLDSRATFPTAANGINIEFTKIVNL